MAGYSGTPLAKKLGIKPGQRAYVKGLPNSIEGELSLALSKVDLKSRIQRNLDFIHFFFSSKSELDDKLPVLKKHLAKNGSLWISWPKKTSSISTDLTRDIVRAEGLRTGLVDIKVCAVDIEWSGLKFVYRRDKR